MSTHDWTVCITRLDVSFKFFKKLPAPPRIWENKPELGIVTGDGLQIIYLQTLFWFKLCKPYLCIVNYFATTGCCGILGILDPIGSNGFPSHFNLLISNESILTWYISLMRSINFNDSKTDILNEGSGCKHPSKNKK